MKSFSRHSFPLGITLIELWTLFSRLPEDLYLAPLDPIKHSKIMDNHWDYKAENSLNLIHQSIVLNGGIGLFRKGVGQPICWISTNEFLTPG